MFKEIADDLTKVMFTEYIRNKQHIIKDVREAGLSLVELNRIENNPRYLMAFDESSAEDVNRVAAYIRIFSKYMPSAIQLSKYGISESGQINVGVGVILKNANRISDRQYSCVLPITQAARLLQCQSIRLSKTVWMPYRKNEKESDEISKKMATGSYCYKCVYLLISRVKYYEDSHTIALYDYMDVISGGEQLAGCSKLVTSATKVDAMPYYLNDNIPVILCVGDDISEYTEILTGKTIASKAARQIVNYIVDINHGMDKRIIDQFNKSIKSFNAHAMASTIDEWYRNISVADVEKIGSWLIEYFNEFCKIFPCTNDVAKTSQTQALFNSSSSIWHIYLSSLIYYDKERCPDYDWKTVLRSTLDIDWSSDGLFAKTYLKKGRIDHDSLYEFFGRMYLNAKKCAGYRNQE